MTPNTFAGLLEDWLKHVEDVVAHLEKGEGHRPALDSLRGHLIDLIDIIERHPGVEAAADDLYDVAARAVSIGRRGVGASGRHKSRASRSARGRGRHRLDRLRDPPVPSSLLTYRSASAAAPAFKLCRSKPPGGRTPPGKKPALARTIR